MFESQPSQFSEALKPQSSPSFLLNYSINKSLSSGDYLCNDLFHNTYLLVQTSSKPFNFSVNPTLLEPYEIVNKDEKKYATFLLSESAQWIGDVSVLKFKSETYCLTILFSLLSQVIEPLLQLQQKQEIQCCEDWLHADNIWVKENTVLYIMAKRSENKKEISAKREKDIIKRLVKILILFFKPDRQQRTILSLIVNSIMNYELDLKSILIILTDKKKKKEYIASKRITQPFRMNNCDELWMKKKYRNDVNQNKWKRRNFKKNDQNSQNTNYVDYGDTLTLGEFENPKILIKSKRSSFGSMFQTKSHRSRSGSKNSHRNYYFSTKCTQKKNERVKIKGYSANIEMIGENMLEKAKKRYNQTISIMRESKIDNYTKVDKDEEFKKVFFSKEKRNNFTQEKPILKKNSSKGLRQIEEFKKQIFLTIDCDSTQTKKKLNQIIQDIDQESQIQRKKKQQNNKMEFYQMGLSKLMESKEAQTLKWKQKQKQIELQIRNRKQRQIDEEIRKRKERQIEEEIRKRKEREIDEEIRLRKEKNIQEEIRKRKQREQQQEIKRQKQRQTDILQAKKSKQKQIQQQQMRKQKQIKQQSQTQNSIEKQKKRNFYNNVENVLDSIQVIESIPKNEINKKLTEKKGNNNKPPLPKKLNSPKKFDDQIEEVVLSAKREKKNEKMQIKPQENKGKQQRTPKNQRMSTGQSEAASSFNPKKPVGKQVGEYMHMINKIGEAVAKSSKISSKLTNIDWFTGIFFVYKRFLFERKKIVKWLQDQESKLTRYSEKDQTEWKEWFRSQQKKTLLSKTKTQNENIDESINKMYKKLLKKNVQGDYLQFASLSKNSKQDIAIAVSQIVKEYDSLEENSMLQDPDIYMHINDLFTALYIFAELEGKIKEKKSLAEILKKKEPKELFELSEKIYDLYIPQ